MLTVSDFIKAKNIKKIVMLTAYDYLFASCLESAGVDALLVGDSLGMVFTGHKDTLPVTVEDVIYHTRAVKRGAGKTFIISDMPFMSYQASVSDALRNAGEIMKKSGADAVKLEGGAEVTPQVKAMVKAGIPVMGHIGLQPQSVKKYGGYPVQGAGKEQEEKLIFDAQALEDAGVFAIVIEKVKATVAAKITKAVSVPVIGIGSGKNCDGQVLVTHDMLGMFEDFTPKFVKKYENLAGRIKKAVGKFAADVRKGKFPGRRHSYE